MMKRSIFAVLGLAAALSLFSPSQAHAGVVIGVGVGVAPVYPRPAYGYVAVQPQPYAYYAPSYAYAPGYVVRPYPGYDRFYGDRGWAYRNWDHRGVPAPRDFRR
jgi:hypothetical protein